MICWQLLHNLLLYGRLRASDVDFRTQVVDDLCHLVEKETGCLGKWDVYTPDLGEYSHQFCYDGFCEMHPDAYWTPTAAAIPCIKKNFSNKESVNVLFCYSNGYNVC